MEATFAGSAKALFESQGDRFKEYERAVQQRLVSGTHSVIRVDGRAFHTLTRGLEKPFSPRFTNAMNNTAKALCAEISGAVFAYVQSDEISVLVTDFAKENTQPWFGGVVAKQVSISAAVASVTFNQYFDAPVRSAVFDSRVFPLPDHHEVIDYFLWRQRDSYRNAILSIAQSCFSHRELQGKNVKTLRYLLLEEKGVSLGDYPLGNLMGRLVTKEIKLEEVRFFDKRTKTHNETQALRSHWVVNSAPDFTNGLDDLVPVAP